MVCTRRPLRRPSDVRPPTAKSSITRAPPGAAACTATTASFMLLCIRCEYPLYVRAVPGSTHSHRVALSPVASVPTGQGAQSPPALKYDAAHVVQLSTCQAAGMPRAAAPGHCRQAVRLPAGAYVPGSQSLHKLTPVS